MPELYPTPGQTIGPFFSDRDAGYGLGFDRDHELVAPGHPAAIVLHGTVYDGDGAVVPDALIEIRQADVDGSVPTAAGSLRRDGTVFTGWGRATADPAGHFRFTTVEPAAADGAAPFFAVTVFARGLLDRLFTRAYVPGDDAGLTADPVLSALPAERRDTLIAVREDATAATGVAQLRFDIRLQGCADGPETVFLTFPRHQHSVDA